MYKFKLWLLDRLLVSLTKDSNLVSHAQKELSSSLRDPEDGPNRWIAEGTIQLIRLFSTQGHSGGSAPWARKTFDTLADFQPLEPLTGEDEEWGKPFDEDGTQQNLRCSHVFRKNGEAYDSQGRVFREPNGCSYTSSDSHVPVTFPYTPTIKYVDVEAPND